MNAGAVRGRAHERSDYDDFIIARANCHAHAVILAALLFAEQGIRLGIKKIRVRIKRVQHARDGSVVNGLIRVHGLGIVLFDNLVHLSELLQAVTNVRVTVRCRRCVSFLGEQHA